MLSHVHVPTHLQNRLGVIYYMHKSIFDCMLLLHNCMWLIKIYAYSYVTIKQTAVIDYQIKVTFINILILKAIDSL